MLYQVAKHVAEENEGRVQELQAGLSRALDRGTIKAEEAGAEINRQLRQASDSIAEQTETSQSALEVSIMGSASTATAICPCCKVYAASAGMEGSYERHPVRRGKQASG